ncbi:hypothetical protein V5O48_013930 [Marasmius crinis-equi]|uniref:Uncharacterized protein n=1 Tax=Marasmius crinis-equi TaxID=585013 RepID=A0ABR3EYQ0_9AGAR
MPLEQEPCTLQSSTGDYTFYFAKSQPPAAAAATKPKKAKKKKSKKTTDTTSEPPLEAISNDEDNGLVHGRGLSGIVKRERLDWLESLLPSYFELGKGSQEKADFWEAFPSQYFPLFPKSKYLAPPSTLEPLPPLTEKHFKKLSRSEKAARKKKEARCTESEEQHIIAQCKRWFWYCQNKSSRDQHLCSVADGCPRLDKFDLTEFSSFGTHFLSWTNTVEKIKLGLISPTDTVLNSPSFEAPDGLDNLFVMNNDDELPKPKVTKKGKSVKGKAPANSGAKKGKAKKQEETTDGEDEEDEEDKEEDEEEDEDNNEDNNEDDEALKKGWVYKPSPYELQREQNIARNKEIMEQIGLRHAVAALAKDVNRAASTTNTASGSSPPSPAPSAKLAESNEPRNADDNDNIVMAVDPPPPSQPSPSTSSPRAQFLKVFQDYIVEFDPALEVVDPKGYSGVKEKIDEQGVYLLDIPEDAAKKPRPPIYKALVYKWMELESVLQLLRIPEAKLSTQCHLLGFKAWFKDGRFGRPRGFQTLAAVQLSEIRTSWWKYYDDNMPDWRTRIDGKVTLGEGDWEDCELLGQDSVVLFLVALKWWHDMGGATDKSSDWDQAVKSLFHTLD